MTRVTRKAEDASPAWVDAWLERNGDALEASIRKGLEEYERGEFDTRTMDEVIADLRRRHRKTS